jgi:predicted nucleic acid-binding protein
VPSVVVDTNVSLPATLISTGLMRKFWILLAFGAATYRTEHLQLELEALEREANDAGGEAGGQDALPRLTTQAERARAAMEELLPVGLPSDWVAVGGVDLFSEYERKVEEVAAKLGVDPPPDPAVARRQVEAVCVTAEPSFDPADVPALTTDPDDDLIVWTALSAGADFLISDDRDVVPDDADGSRLFSHGERSVLAMRFRHLVDNYLHDIDWGQINGRVLPQLYRAGALDE